MTIQAEQPENVAQYFKRIGALLVQDTTPEALFKEIAKLASEICGTPIALINLIDHKRQWFKENVGLDSATRIDHDIAFFSHAILKNTVIEIPDARLDQRLKHNPLVTQKPNMRFYAGVPIIMPSGKKVGTLSVIDHREGVLSPLQKNMLEGLAQVAAQALVPQATHQISKSAHQLVATNASSSHVVFNNIDDKIKSWRKSIEAMAA